MAGSASEGDLLSLIRSVCWPDVPTLRLILRSNQGLSTWRVRPDGCNQVAARCVRMTRDYWTRRLECRFSSGSSHRILQRPRSAYASAWNAACPWPSTRNGAPSVAGSKSWIDETLSVSVSTSSRTREGDPLSVRRVGEIVGVGDQQLRRVGPQRKNRDPPRAIPGCVDGETPAVR